MSTHHVSIQIGEGYFIEYGHMDECNRHTPDRILLKGDPSIMKITLTNLETGVVVWTQTVNTTKIVEYEFLVGP